MGTNIGFRALVLDDGQYWGVYGEYDGPLFVITELMQGSGVASNGSYSVSDLKGFTATETGSLSLSASYGAGSMNGNLTSGAYSSAFTSSIVDASVYDYAATPVLSNIAGNWTMYGLVSAAYSLNIAADGNFTGSINGCIFSGSLAPRASGKNVWDLAISYGAAPCPVPNQQASGIAIDYSITGGYRQLMMMSVDSTRSSGAIMLGTR